jgi:crossover junction endodeoxyribonuclease RusA
MRDVPRERNQVITFTVYGIAQPQGSTRAFMPKGAKFPIITSDNKKLKPWRQEIAGTALQAMQSGGLARYVGPVRLEARFIFSRPKSAKKDAKHKMTRPDVDKLARGLMDALTGIAYVDDSQVTVVWVCKLYGEDNRTEVTIESVA